MMADRGSKIDSDKVDTNKENCVRMTGTEKELVAVRYLMRCTIIEVLRELKFVKAF
jgi:hypothetical protein